MAEVRCPMCSKSNPAGADHCEFCGARLRPVWESGPADAGAQSSDAGIPDWLRSLGGEAQPDEPAPAPSSLPDWLTSLRDEPGEPEPEPPAGGGSGGSSDWLDSLLAESDPAAARPQDELPEDGGDWLRRIGAPGETGTTDQAQPPDAEWAADEPAPEPLDWGVDASDGLPDWLKGDDRPAVPPANRTSDWDAPAEAAPEWLKSAAGESPPSGAPDWLKAMSAEAPEESATGTSGFESELPDWLTGAAPTTEAHPAVEPPVEATTPDWLKEDAAEAALPDWLSDVEPAAAEETSAAGETAPDWLQSASTEEELPDWLSGAEPAATTATSTTGDEAPDWLRAYDIASEPAERETRLEPDTLDWLTESTSAGERLGEEPPAAEPSTAGGFDDLELPDWLTGAEPAAPEAPAAGGEQPPARTGMTGMLSWMAASGEAAPDWFTDAAGESEAEAEERPDWLPEPAAERSFVPEVFQTPEPPPEREAFGADEESDMAGWLAALDSGPLDTGRPAAEPAEVGADDSDLSWLNELESTYSGLALDAEATPDDSGALNVGMADETGGLDQGELPAWLRGADMDLTEEPEAADAEEDSSLKVDELPSWLQAMRPVGAADMQAPAVADESGAQPVEGAGPLAGLRGVLPAELDILQVAKPPVYTVRMQVSEAQELQAKILSDLYEAEAQPPEQIARPVVTSTAVFRLAIAAILILALLASILSGWPNFGTPFAAPEVVAATAARQMVEGLAPGAPVLFAVDYDPGYSAEMDALAGAVLRHVMGRGALPVFVATTPTGPLQAERVLRQIGAESGRIFSARQDYVNLGFLPGGAMGLAGFVQDPLGALPLETSLGQPARDVPALQGVDSLAGFQMIVVATESPERARSWVEQIETQAAADARPALLMVVSAQADPLVRPYYAAQPQQVQGLVSGLTGGLAYAEASAQSGPAQAYWPAFNAGLLVAVVLMLFGGVASLISGRLAKRNAPQEGEAA